MKSTGGDDSDSRRQEINMFAAMALGEDPSFLRSSSPISVTEKENTSGRNNESSSVSTHSTPVSVTGSINAQHDFQNIFALAASQETADSGTFAMTPSLNGSSTAAQSSNLDAAVAALSGKDELSAGADAASTELLFPKTEKKRKRKNLAKDIPMYSEEVILSRPLFFGPVLPPRVLNTARAIVKDAIDERLNGMNENDPPLSLSMLPPQVTNLVRAISVYGHGLSIFDEQLGQPKQEENNDQEWKGSSRVSTFQPVFGDLSRLHRLEASNQLKSALEKESREIQESDHSGHISKGNEKDIEQDIRLDPPQPEMETNQKNDNDMFLNWASGDYQDSLGGSMHSSHSVKQKSTDTNKINDTDQPVEAPEPMSDQDLFSYWARGESPLTSGTFRGSVINDNQDFHGTFQRLPTGEDSDDDSVIGSELKKKVGVNEHLDAALASLVNDGTPSADSENMTEQYKQGLLSQIDHDSPEGTPITNFELTNGSIPLYGVDDSPLPVEGDLGIHETKEEQQRFFEQRRSQEIIEKLVGPNLFGPVACPNPSTNPDDNHGWNSRAANSFKIMGVSRSRNIDRIGGGVPGTSESPRRPPNPALNRSAPNINTNRKRHKNSPKVLRSTKGVNSNKRQGHAHSRSRFGWWNVPNEPEAVNKKQDSMNFSGEKHDSRETLDKSSTEDKYSSKLQLPPMYHRSIGPLVQTQLEPTPGRLRKENRPLSSSHAASSMAESLAYLSDRPPNCRYLQIDTQTVGFPLGGEIEPLFCSLSIYNVETVSAGGKDASVLPIPDLQRSGRVTEALNFDVVSDRDVESSCIGSLWPGSSESKRAQSAQMNNNDGAVFDKEDEGNRLQGTRCGVFPLPSNLNVANLYAVLVVHKVLAEESDFEIYLKPSRSFDIDKSRAKAEKASNTSGNFLMPFAFGVVPLLQVFGTETPVVASSRAVQIFLHRFSPGRGERQIIDHIMVMLYPRADFRSNGMGGPAAVTNGGTAMLVMRHFGYLGLHSIVHSMSSLARDRIVDFTGELQIRRRNEDDEPPSEGSTVVDGNTYISPPWHNEYITEPTLFGGRNSVEIAQGKRQMLADLASPQTTWGDDPSRSPIYAIELAPIPLQLTPPARRTLAGSPDRLSSPRDSSHSLHSMDTQPFFHTSFCNELLCHPRLLHNCQKGNIIMKVEFREMEWKQDCNAYFAHIPHEGPSVHNPRRGPFLVQSAFTSCAVRSSDPHFLDEFKLKLPLHLKRKRKDSSVRTLSLFFSVYHVKLSPKRKWAKRIQLASKKATWKGEFSDYGDSVTECNDEAIASGKCRLELLSCGFLPITTQACLVENGLHDVRMIYTARHPPREQIESGKINASVLIITEKNDLGNFSRDSKKTNSYVEGRELELLVRGNQGPDDGTECESLASDIVRSDPGPRSNLKDGQSKPENTVKQKSGQDRMTLQVRILVHSSLHAQNATLCDFLQQEPDQPGRLNMQDKTILSVLQQDRTKIVHQLAKTFSKPKLEEKKMVKSTINIANMKLCSMSDVILHFMRVVPKLLRTMVSGMGTTELILANPAAKTPLRVHSFATLIHLFGASVIYMSKNGVTQLDGCSQWDVITFGRVVSLLFNEDHLFGSEFREVFDKEDLFSPTKSKIDAGLDLMVPTDSSPKKGGTESSQQTPKRKNRHVRSSYELLNVLPRLEDEEDPSNIDLSNLFGLSGGVSSRYDGEDSKIKSNTFGGIPKRESSSLTSSNVDNKLKAELSNNNSLKDVKIDTVADFQNAMEAGLTEMDCGEQSDEVNASAASALSMIQALGSNPRGSRRWLTAPNPALTTIQESVEVDDTETGRRKRMEKRKEESSLDQNNGVIGSFDSELVLKSLPRGSVKQMRVPKVKKANNVQIPKEEIVANQTKEDGVNINLRKALVPKSDDEIENAGAAFLDVIGKSLGISADVKEMKFGEERRVGHAYHRKTRSKCSIDWTLVGDESTPNLPEEGSKFLQDNLANEKSQPKVTSIEHKETMSTLVNEENNSVKLPGFVDRLIFLGKSADSSGRWFPYTYEVIIMLWVPFLSEHRAVGEKVESTSCNDRSGLSLITSLENQDFNNCISEAASRSFGAAFASAPLLFEIIKQSLGKRLQSTFRAMRSKSVANSENTPLALLDEGLMASLEQLFSLLTDSCIESRNFDTPYLRQMSIDVNDSIIRFLRDMFGFLAPTCVHRLILVYMSRFVTTEGKHMVDRDSSLGLRCSWEVTKLRLNAVTALIRFPDFIRVSSPQINNYGDWWLNAPDQSSSIFFNEVLEHFKKLQHNDFVTVDGAQRSKSFDLTSMRPHWLSEIVVDICLSGTEHAEQHIQQRSSSLLFELFWQNSQQGMADGTSSAIGSMYLTFLEKILWRSMYLSNFTAKSQLKKDILPCAIFVMQCAPTGLLRALWRLLCTRLVGKGNNNRFGGIKITKFAGSEGIQDHFPKTPRFSNTEPDILDMFTLLNMALGTIEYEGCDDLLDSGSIGDSDDHFTVWRKEYLLARVREKVHPFQRQKHAMNRGGFESKPDADGEVGFDSTSSRKWQAHDGSMVIVSTGNQIVWEMYSLLNLSVEGQMLLNPARRKSKSAEHRGEMLDPSSKFPRFSHSDIVIFVRAATSLYLHSLVLRQSDIVLVKTFQVAAELVKIFGIKIFLEGVGETLQHWMRVVSVLCGARRAEVRVEATDFLELVLRSTWESYGSFFRIRLPLLSVYSEVLEKIVSTAVARYYREERRFGTTFDNFTNASAEASLAPLWRTLDRLHYNPASQNTAFRGALIRLAEKLKKLYRAYIARRTLSFLNGARSPEYLGTDSSVLNHSTIGSDALVRACRISVLKVINASAGYSKQFLGFHGASLQRSAVAHYEAVEDAFLDAADVFSPTELPEHRVAWLRMLADFHATRKKLAEEGTCHFHIHVTLKQAASLHGSLWSNTPFLPWTESIADPVHIDGANPNVSSTDYGSEFDFDATSDSHCGIQVDDANSSRRIFYRVANSVRANTEDWETGLSKTLFCGVTFAADFCTVSPWTTRREMEESMVEEAESAGDLFLRAGIIESSRFAWNLATQYYSEKFNYGKLAQVYGCLAKAVVSRVPPIDASQQQEVSISLGRFYRVWFHGGAPDELIGAEFVYRTASWVRLEQFGDGLREVIKSIIPERTPIHLVLDGRDEDSSQRNYGGFGRLGPAPLEPVRIKVTPLRPLFDKAYKIRGLPEWFNRYIDETFSRPRSQSESLYKRQGSKMGSSQSDISFQNSAPGHRKYSRSPSASMFSSGNSTGGSLFARRINLSKVSEGNRGMNSSGAAENELVGVDKFCFLQPIHKDRIRGTKDWWKNSSGDFAEKCLKVTQLKVCQFFPACVSRQAVLHRITLTQSPLEAGVDAVCQWCSVLFRTAVATNGMTVLGINYDPGIGNDAAKVVADCIHSSRVKEMGLALLKKNSKFTEEESNTDILPAYDRLTEDEVKNLQGKLARSIIVFMELLHLLIARNRDLLLNVIQERKKEGTPSFLAGGGSLSVHSSSGFAVAGVPSLHRTTRSYDAGSTNRHKTDDPSRGLGRSKDKNNNFHGDEQPQPPGGSIKEKPDAAIAVQSELQRSFISLAKALFPMVSGIMQIETPRWLKHCCQENYFSLGTYRQARIPIAEELCFSAGASIRQSRYSPVEKNDHSAIASVLPLSTPPGNDYCNEIHSRPSRAGSIAGSSVLSRGSENG